METAMETAMETLIKELREIAMDAGDNLDREGNYTSDRLRVVISKMEDLMPLERQTP